MSLKFQQQRSPLPAQATTLPLVCEEESASTPMDDHHQPQHQPPEQQPEPAAAGPAPLGQVKKSGARRNPWGNMSYADLITQARLSDGDSQT